MSTKEEIIVCMAMKAESMDLFDNVINNISSDKYNFHLLYTGIGKVKATYSLTKKITELKMLNKNIKMVLNFGSAGGYNIAENSICICNKFIQNDMSQSAVNLEHGVNLSTNFGMKNCNELSDEIGLVIEHKNIIEIDNIDNVYCLTADSFITNKELFKYSIKEVQEKFVEEMEGFALAYVCKKENIAFNAVKYVSDDINKNNGGNDFIEILKKGIVAKKLVDILNIILLKYFI